MSRNATGSNCRRGPSSSTGRVSGTIRQITSAATTDVPALIQNSRLYPTLARTPALTVETEKPRLIAQKSSPYARTRSLGWSRSATVACTAGRNMSPIRPTTKAAIQIVPIERAEPSRISAAAVPRNPISIVRRRPNRSAIQPPTSCEMTEPAPTAAATAPAVPADRWRSWVR